MISGREKKAALEYARFLGWRPPGEVSGVARTALEVKLEEAQQRLDQTEGVAAEALERALAAEAALAAEQESHEVMKRALLRTRGKGAAGLRIASLEKALRKLTSDDVSEEDVLCAKELLE